MKSKNIHSHKDCVVTRKFKVLRITGSLEDTTAKLIDSQRALNLRLSENTLIISYNVSTTSLEEILSLIEKNGIELKANLCTKLLIGWYKYIDQNIHDNANHKPHCCNKAPKI
ncbi:hypothetical protein QKW35_17555 [Pontibacterium granulatum]|uniref:hypothetical protein n=1 Tax=Pontibacterium granulatum TaxID=2036029 RepID=UPI00249A6B77|nr:hypothetical protein [Pontibacterium granulatum]MDI3326190.1 hypothetical protein [Pontibacterium granulatum]